MLSAVILRNTSQLIEPALTLRPVSQRGIPRFPWLDAGSDHAGLNVVVLWELIVWPCDKCNGKGYIFDIVSSTAYR